MTASAAEAPAAAATSRRHVRRAIAGLIVANSCLACGPWLVRLSDVGPVAAAFWRLSLAVPFLLVLGGVARQPLSAVPRAAWPLLIVAGLAFAADLAVWHVGILHTRLANATLFGNSASFFFAVYGFVAARRLPGRTQGAALVLAALGLGLLVGRSFELSPEHVLGDALCIVAGLFYTVYLIAMDSTRGQVPPFAALAAFTIIALLPLLPVAAALGEAIMPRDWTPLVLLAIGGQLLGQGLILYALGHLPPILVGLGLLTQPIVAAAIGWVFYGERLAAADGVGAAAIAVALILVRREPRDDGAGRKLRGG